MPCVIVFDVNETLLDLKGLDAHFERAFRTAGVGKEWFRQVVQSALLTTRSRRLFRLRCRRGVGARNDGRGPRCARARDDRDAILGAMRELPPHPEVPESLRRLREAGLRLCALTNSTQTVAETQLGHAGLARYFERIMSADMVRRLKPDAQSTA